MSIRAALDVAIKIANILNRAKTTNGERITSEFIPKETGIRTNTEEITEFLTLGETEKLQNIWNQLKTFVRANCWLL